MWGADLFRRAAANLPRADEVRLDWRIVLFTLSLSVVTTVLFGLFPALRATRSEVAGTLSHGNRAQVGDRRPVQGLLVSTQIALAVVLLVGAGLLIRTLARLGQTSLGFRPDRVLALRVSASWGEKANMKRVEQHMFRTIEALNALPGVESAAIAIDLPGGGKEDLLQFHVEGRDTTSEGERLFADTQTISPDYFRVLGIPMLAGDTCRLSFDHKTPEPVIVNRSFADRFLPNDNPVGHHLRFEHGAPAEIVGVAGDVRDHGYAQDPKPTIYWCGLPGFYPDPEYLVKTDGDPMGLAEPIRRQLASIEPSRAVYDVIRLADFLSSSLAEKRFQTALLSLFGLTALLLAAIGLYGVASFAVAQRTREIGLRVALGARPAHILAQVFRQGARMAGAGLALGLAAAAVLSRSIASLLFGVSPIDPVTFAAVPLLLLAVTFAAVWAPARRAARVDPMEALRQE